MGYDIALTKAWLELEGLKLEKKQSVRFLADEYDIDLENKNILSVSCNIPAKDHLSILILHYFLQKLKGLPPETGQWLSFKELPGKPKELSELEWLQNSAPFGDCIITIDANRNSFILTDLENRQYDIIHVDPDWAIQDIAEVGEESKTLVKKIKEIL